MNRCKLLASNRILRRSLKIALSVTLTTGSTAWSTQPLDSATGSTTPENWSIASQVELPEYPFDDSPAARCSQTTAAPAGNKVLRRWLGLKSNRDSQITDRAGSNQEPTLSHSSESRQVTTAIHLSHAAIATPQVPVAVTTYEGETSVDPQELVDSISLDDSTERIVSPKVEEDSQTEFALSDDTRSCERELASAGDECGSDLSESDTVIDRPASPALRKPELVKVHQGFSLQDRSSTSIPPAGTANLTSQASSRRSQQPQAMKLNLNADEVVSQPRAPRPPLVPMLVQPAVGNHEAAKLQKLMQANHTQSEDSTGSIHEVQAGKITVNPKSVASLKTEGKIVGLSIEHEDICQVMQNGIQTCTLVGLREGITRVALIEESNGQRQVKIYGVQVGTSGSASSDLNCVLDGLSRTIERLYPSADVRLTRREQKLVVSGQTDSEASARKILELVRKTTLMPVQDQLKTF